MKHMRLARREDGSQISNLRLREFNRSSDFKLLKSKTLYWSKRDEVNTVIGVWHGSDTLVATLRLISVNNDQVASQVLEAAVPVSVQFPGLVFNSAATRHSFRRQGFNQLLRYYSIQAAANCGIKSLLSPVYQSAPRIDFMKKLGYSSHTLTDNWQTKLAPNSPRIICILEAKQFAGALEILRHTIPDLLENYPWIGPPISL